MGFRRFLMEVMVLKINKGKIKNVSKKVFAVGMTFVLVPAVFSGCDTNINSIEYTTNEKGYVESLAGTVKRIYLNDCEFRKVTNKITGETFYTIVFYNFDNLCYYDIFTKQKLVSRNFDTDYIILVNDYITAYNMEKAEYTKEDLEELLNIFIENQNKEKTTEKQLTK